MAQQFQRPIEGFGVAGAPSFVREGAALRGLAKERVEGGGHVVDSHAVARRHLEKGAAAVAGDGFEVASERFGAGQIAFVDDEEVGHLDEARLHGLDVVAESGREDEGGQVGEAHDVELGLADAHCLDDHRVAAKELHQARGRGGGCRQSAEASARGHGSDGDMLVTGVAHHAHAIAEDGAAREGRGGIDSDEANATGACAEVVDETRGECGFACAASASQADGRRFGQGELFERTEEFAGAIASFFGEGDGAAQGAGVVGAHFVEERAAVAGQGHGVLRGGIFCVRRRRAQRRGRPFRGAFRA